MLRDVCDALPEETVMARFFVSEGSLLLLIRCDGVGKTSRVSGLGEVVPPSPSALAADVVAFGFEDGPSPEGLLFFRPKVSWLS